MYLRDPVVLAGDLVRQPVDPEPAPDLPRRRAELLATSTASRALRSNRRAPCDFRRKSAPRPLNGAIRAIPYDLLMDFVGRPSLLDRGRRPEPAVRRRHARPPHRRLDHQRSVCARPRRPAGGHALQHHQRRRRAARPGRRRPARLHRPFRRHDCRDPVVRRRRARHDSIPGCGAKSRSRTCAWSRPGAKSCRVTGCSPRRRTSAPTSCRRAPANEAILGQIIAIVDGVYAAGKYQVVAINRGKRTGSPRATCSACSTVANWSATVRSPELVGLHGELRKGAPAGRAQRDGPAVHGRGPHELRPGRAVVAGDPGGDFIAHPEFGHKEGGSTDFAK